MKKGDAMGKEPEVRLSLKALHCMVKVVSCVCGPTEGRYGFSGQKVHAVLERCGINPEHLGYVNNHADAWMVREFLDSAQGPYESVSVLIPATFLRDLYFHRHIRVTGIYEDGVAACAQLCRAIASGEVTEEMLKEQPRELLKHENLVRFGP